jgi:hypothetical protein
MKRLGATMGATPQQPITHKKLFECLRINQKEIK